MRVIKASLLIVGLGLASTANAQQACDPSDFLQMDTEVIELADYLSYAGISYSEGTRTEGRDTTANISLPVKGVPVSFGGGSAASLAQMFKTQSQFSLTKDQRRFLQIRQLSRTGFDAYSACLKTRDGAYVEVSGTPVESTNFGMTARSGQPGAGRKLIVTVINGKPSADEGTVSVSGNQAVLSVPFPAASEVPIVISGRDVTRATLITTAVRLPNGEGMASANVIEIPPKFGFRLVEELVTNDRLDFKSHGSDEINRTDCIKSSSDEGDLVPSTAAWLNTWTNRPVRFNWIQSGGTPRLVCGRMRANSSADFPRVRVIGSMSAVRLKLVPLEVESSDRFGTSIPN